MGLSRVPGVSSDEILKYNEKYAGYAHRQTGENQMIVKLQRFKLDPSEPYDEYLFECEDVHIRTHWLTHPKDRWLLHSDPDQVWSPFIGRRGYNFPTGDPDDDQSFVPYGVLLLTLEGPKRYKEIWIEIGIAWMMEKGKTVSKASPPSREDYLKDKE